MVKDIIMWFKFYLLCLGYVMFGEHFILKYQHNTLKKIKKGKQKYSDECVDFTDALTIKFQLYSNKKIFFMWKKLAQYLSEDFFDN